MNEFVLSATLSRLLAEQRSDIDWRSVGMLCQLSPLTCEKRFSEVEVLVRDVHRALERGDQPEPVGVAGGDDHGDEDHERASSEAQDTDVVIHVLDESKNARQDFSCPRELLIREMAYFGTVLPNGSRESPSDELDISVHCDLFVFDWLMRYVKSRPQREGHSPTKSVSNESSDPEPQLERGNVVSILIASNYLKMVSLVDLCLRYLRDNLEAIISSPTNLNCINDELVTRIAQSLTHNELDDLKDKRDRFRSKLFVKKIELLFHPSGASADSSESAASLFRCCLCKQLLTHSLSTKLPCSSERIMVDQRGALRYSHEADPGFNLVTYLRELRTQLTGWRDVYFKLWATVNYLQCSKCWQHFPLAELGQCRYHRNEARVDGVHSCCGRETVRFDLFASNNGCAMCDHVPLKTANNRQLVEKLWTDTQRRRDLICFPAVSTQLAKMSANSRPCSVFERQNVLLDELLRRRLPSNAASVRLCESETQDRETPPKNAARKGVERSLWDTSRSQRTNQDMQRQEDTRRLRKLAQDLVAIREKKETDKKEEKSVVAGGRIIKEFAGGLFARVEAQWRHRFASAGPALLQGVSERASFSSTSSFASTVSTVPPRSSTAVANTSLTRAKIRPSAVISPKSVDNTN